MKRSLIILLVILIALPIFAEVKIGGLAQMYYENFSKATGQEDGDNLTTDYLYLIIKSDVAENIKAMMILDGSDLIYNTGNEIELATIDFSVNDKFDVIIGKQEMPFGQNYDKNLTHDWTWGIHSMINAMNEGYAAANLGGSTKIMMEIDKVWGINLCYKFNDKVKLEGAVYQQTEEFIGAGNYSNEQDELFNNMTIRLTANELAENLGLNLSYASENKGGGTAEDQKKMSFGVTYKINAFKLFGEYISVNDIAGVKDSDLSVTQLGLEYAKNKWVFRPVYEMADVDNSDNSPALLQLGVDYKMQKNATIQFEYLSSDMDEPGKDAHTSFKLGAILSL